MHHPFKNLSKVASETHTSQRYDQQMDVQDIQQSGRAGPQKRQFSLVQPSPSPSQSMNQIDTLELMQMRVQPTGARGNATTHDARSGHPTYGPESVEEVVHENPLTETRQQFDESSEQQQESDRRRDDFYYVKGTDRELVEEDPKQ